MSIARPKQLSPPKQNFNENYMSSSLTNIFTDYSVKNTGIDGARFLKFCKDAHLFTDKSFRPEDVDLVFAKFKEKGQRYMCFEGFMSAIVSIASKKNTSTTSLIEKIIESSPSAQPNSATVIPLSNRFHDDHSTFTGVHKAGGPTIIDSQHRNLSQMLDRDVKSNMDWQLSNEMKALSVQATETNTKIKQSAAPVPSPRTTTQSFSPVKPVLNKDPMKSNDFQMFESHSSTQNDNLKHIFNDYAVKTCPIPGGGIDGAKFLKLCRDLYLFDTKFRPQDLDVVFAKYKEQGLRHMGYQGFINSIIEISNRKDIDSDALINHILKTKPSAKPSSATVVPKPNRFHDDQSTYTGVHKAGGPTNVDRHHITLSKMVNRAPGSIQYY